MATSPYGYLLNWNSRSQILAAPISTQPVAPFRIANLGRVDPATCPHSVVDLTTGPNINPNFSASFVGNVHFDFTLTVNSVLVLGFCLWFIEGSNEQVMGWNYLTNFHLVGPSNPSFDLKLTYTVLASTNG